MGPEIGGLTCGQVRRELLQAGGQGQPPSVESRFSCRRFVRQSTGKGVIKNQPQPLLALEGGERLKPDKLQRPRQEISAAVERLGFLQQHEVDLLADVVGVGRVPDQRVNEGMHVYAWESELYVDTLLLPAEREYDSVYGTPGEFSSGNAHAVGDRVFLRWGKTLPWLFEVEGWNTANGISPLTTLPETIAIEADQIANPPELALQIRGGAGAARVARLQPLPRSGPLLDGSLVGWESCEPVQFGDKTNRVEVRCGYAQDAVFLRWQVETEAAMRVPPLPAPERIFAHDRPGTTLSFYLQGDAAATGRNQAGRPVDVRIVCGLYDDNGTIRSAAVGLYPRWDGSGEPRPFLYASPGQ